MPALTAFPFSGYFNADIKEWRYAPGEPVNFILSFGVDLVQHKNDRYSNPSHHIFRFKPFIKQFPVIILNYFNTISFLISEKPDVSIFTK